MHLGGVRVAFQAEGTAQATVRRGMALSGVSRWSLVCTLGGIRGGTKPGDGLFDAVRESASSWQGGMRCFLVGSTLVTFISGLSIISGKTTSICNLVFCGYCSVHHKLVFLMLKKSKGDVHVK